MHSKAFHRILGLIVLFSIVLLILPFWDGEDELSINERVVQPPSFPDKPVRESRSKSDSVFSRDKIEALFEEELRENG